MISATSAFEREALKPLLVLNGGGLIVYLALIGASAAADSRIEIAPEWARGAMLAWGFGLISIALAFVFGYLSQFSFRKHRGAEVRESETKDYRKDADEPEEEQLSGAWATDAERQRRTSYVGALFSFLLFIVGMFLAFQSIEWM